MRLTGSILMPLEGPCTPLRLEIQLCVMELDVRPYDICSKVDHQGVGHKLPERGVLVLWTADTVKPGTFGAMAFFEDVDFVGLGKCSRSVDAFSHRAAKAVEIHLGNKLR